MGSSKIESLLRAANSSDRNDTSINLAKRVFLEESEASAFFQYKRSALFQISEWKKNSSVTEYDLFDEAGKLANGDTISIGKFIRIALYGSGKYDWVRVMEIFDEQSETVLVITPSHDPTKESGDSSISHFFSPEAVNNFCIQLNDKTVAFYVIGLDEHQNTKFTDGLIETARNAAVANIGYYSGLQKGVWKEFCIKFLEADDEKERAA